MISYSLVRFDFRLSDLLHLECVGEEVWTPPGEGASGEGDAGEGQGGENEAPVLGERPQVLRVGGGGLPLLTLRQTLGSAPVMSGLVTNSIPFCLPTHNQGSSVEKVRFQ